MNAPTPPPLAPGTVDLAKLARLVWTHRVRVAATTVAAGLLTLGLAFLMPRWYRSTAVILPPEDSDVLTNMTLAQRALTKFPAMGTLPDFSTPADIFKAILQSRTVQEEVVRTHDLRQVYHLKSQEQTLKGLKANTSVKLNSDGTISISVDDRDPVRAAAMANTYLVALDRFNVEKRNTQAHRTHLFLERRVAEVNSALNWDEAVLRKYQEEHFTVSPPTVASGDVQVAADLLARKIMLEVRLGMLRSYLREDNEQVVQTRLELEQLKDRIATIPALQDELGRLIRSVKIQEQLYMLLTSELEQARIRETMDTPTVQVLDEPVPAEHQVRPRRGLLALAGAVLAFFASVAYLALRPSTVAGTSSVDADPR